MPDNFWDQRKVDWYDRALAESDYSGKILSVIIPLIKSCLSVIDVGAGCGPIAVPLAKLDYNVTALEPSPSMMNKIKEKVDSEKLSNLRMIEKKFEDSVPGHHDAAIVANVRKLFMDIPMLLNGIEKISPQTVILITGADTSNNKFYFNELYPIIFGKSYPERETHEVVFDELFRFGIKADVTFISYNLDQPFVSLDEAVIFWKAYMKLEDSRFDETLREFLSGKLVYDGKWLRAEVKKKSAIIWWDRESR